MGLKRGSARFSYSMILLAAATANSDGADYFAVSLQGNAAREDHDPAAVRSVDSEELAAGLGVFRQIFRCNVECSRGKGLVDGDIDAAKPGAIHADMSHQIASRVGYGNVHGLTDLSRFFFGGGNHPSCITESYHTILLSDLPSPYQMKGP
jgi:hypothetical protein